MISKKTFNFQFPLRTKSSSISKYATCQNWSFALCYYISIADTPITKKVMNVIFPYGIFVKVGYLDNSTSLPQFALDKLDNP